MSTKSRNGVRFGNALRSVDATVGNFGRGGWAAVRLAFLAASLCCVLTLGCDGGQRPSGERGRSERTETENGSPMAASERPKQATAKSSDAATDEFVRKQLGLADLYLQLGRTAEARKAFQEAKDAASEASPELQQAVTEMAKRFQQVGKRSEAPDESLAKTDQSEARRADKSGQPESSPGPSGGEQPVASGSTGDSPSGKQPTVPAGPAPESVAVSSSNAPSPAADSKSEPRKADTEHGELSGRVPVGKKQLDRTSVSDDEVENFVKGLQSVPDPAEALRQLNGFAISHKLTGRQEAILRAERRVWEKRLRDGLVLFGNHWVPKKSLEERRRQADEAWQRAIDQLSQEKFEEARVNLRKVKNLNPEDVRANFLLGLLSLPGLGELEEGRESFREALGRKRRFPPALNNLALFELWSRDFRSALKYWTQAVEMGSSAAAHHNLGLLLALHEAKRLDVPPNLLADFGLLYKKSGKPVPPEQLNRGWAVDLSPVSLQGPDDASPPLPVAKLFDAGADEPHLVLATIGSGFVVSPGYIVTEVDVVRHGSLGQVDVLRALDLTAPEKPHVLDCELVACSAVDSLALLKCEQSTAPPIPVAAEGPRVNLPVVTLGADWNPESADLVAFGTATVLAHLELGPFEIFGLDSEFPFYFRGGAVCDSKGRVVGVLSSPKLLEDCSLVVPASRLSKWLQSSLPDWKPTETLGSDKAPEELHADYQKSIVPVCGFWEDHFRTASATMKRATFEGDTLFYKICCRCLGQGQVDCPKCVDGKVKTPVRVPVARDPHTGHVVYRTVFQPKPCGHCHARGKVTCKNCSGTGTEPDL